MLDFQAGGALAVTSLAVISVRVVEVIPGKTTVGIEIPNEQREMIRLTGVVGSRMFDDASSPLSLMALVWVMIC